MLRCFQDGDPALAPGPQEQPSCENWTLGEDALSELQLQSFPADTTAEGHENETDMVCMTESN